MTDITSKLRALNACSPGCEGRCSACPDEVGRDAADKIEQLERSLKDTQQVEHAQSKQIERLKAALMRLGNEVRATTSVSEAAIREAAGNTNYRCLMDAESEARVALAYG